MNRSAGRIVIGSTHRGTCFACADGFILTAAHVVGNRDERVLSAADIEMQFPLDNPDSKHAKWISIGAKVVDHDFDLDVAILGPRDERGADALSAIPRISLAKMPNQHPWPVNDFLWSGFGYPDAHSSGLTIHGSIASPSNGSVPPQYGLTELYCAQGGHGGLGGTSGAAVCVDGKAVAVIRYAPPLLKHSTILATPMGLIAGRFKVLEAAIALLCPEPDRGRLISFLKRQRVRRVLQQGFLDDHLDPCLDSLGAALDDAIFVQSEVADLYGGLLRELIDSIRRVTGKWGTFRGRGYTVTYPGGDWHRIPGGGQMGATWAGFMRDLEGARSAYAILESHLEALGIEKPPPIDEQLRAGATTEATPRGSPPAPRATNHSSLTSTLVSGRADSEQLAALAKALRRTGCESRVRLVELDPEQSLSDAGVPQQPAGSLIVALVSKSSIRSAWVERDLLAARNGGVRIVPIRCDDVAVPAWMRESLVDGDAGAAAALMAKILVEPILPLPPRLDLPFRLSPRPSSPCCRFFDGTIESALCEVAFGSVAVVMPTGRTVNLGGRVTSAVLEFLGISSESLPKPTSIDSSTTAHLLSITFRGLDLHLLASTVFNSDNQPRAEDQHRAAQSALEAADRLGCSLVLVPPMGTGPHYGFPSRQAVVNWLYGAMRWAEGDPSIDVRSAWPVICQPGVGAQALMADYLLNLTPERLENLSRRKFELRISFQGETSAPILVSSDAVLGSVAGYAMEPLRMRHALCFRHAQRLRRLGGEEFVYDALTPLGRTIFADGDVIEVFHPRDDTATRPPASQPKRVAGTANSIALPDDAQRDELRGDKAGAIESEAGMQPANSRLHAAELIAGSDPMVDGLRKGALIPGRPIVAYLASLGLQLVSLGCAIGWLAMGVSPRTDLRLVMMVRVIVGAGSVLLAWQLVLRRLGRVRTGARKWMVCIAAALGTASFVASAHIAPDQPPIHQGWRYLGRNAKGFHEVLRPKDQARMIWIPPGNGHSVGFFIDRYEVTWNQYLSFSRSTGREEPAARPKWAGEESPVALVTSADAAAYAQWVGCDLPEIDEWTAAASAGDGRVYPWGSEPVDATRANFGDRRLLGEFPGKTGDIGIDDGYPYPSPVGSFPSGESPFGCSDMAGNVWEYCRSRRSRGAIFIRGGAWSRSAEMLRVSVEEKYPVTALDDAVGFRCVYRAVPLGDESASAVRRDGDTYPIEYLDDFGPLIGAVGDWRAVSGEWDGNSFDRVAVGRGTNADDPTLERRIGNRRTFDLRLSFRLGPQDGDCIARPVVLVNAEQGKSPSGIGFYLAADERMLFLREGNRGDPLGSRVFESCYVKTDLWYNARLAYDGEVLRVKVWDSRLPGPEAWDLSMPVPHAGGDFIKLQNQVAGSSRRHIDWARISITDFAPTNSPTDLRIDEAGTEDPPRVRPGAVHLHWRYDGPFDGFEVWMRLGDGLIDPSSVTPTMEYVRHGESLPLDRAGYHRLAIAGGERTASVTLQPARAPLACRWRVRAFSVMRDGTYLFGAFSPHQQFEIVPP